MAHLKAIVCYVHEIRKVTFDS